MFKIGEFSKLTQVSVRMLRYYDEMGLLKPAEIDAASGYRFYGVEQIPRLRQILFLRDSGFGVGEIATALQTWDEPAIAGELERKREEIRERIESEEQRLAKIDMALRDIRGEKTAVNANVSIKSVPSAQVLSLRRVLPDYYAEGALWKEMAAFAQANGIEVAGQTFSIYHDEDYREKEVDVELCAPVHGMKESQGEFTFRVVEEVPYMASAMVYGEFENIAAAYQAFAAWLSQHAQYRMMGSSRQIVHRGPWNEGEPEKYLTEMQVPLEKKEWAGDR